MKTLRYVTLCLLLSAASYANADKVKSPYDDIAIVTNTVNWPYNASTYGNDTFQLGDDENEDTKILNEVLKNGLHFENDFEFGVACSAYQYEGYRKPPSSEYPNGIGWSLWDEFSSKKENNWLNPKGANIANVSPTSKYTIPNGDEAIDGYHRFKEDIKLVKESGATVYRLSISWPRLFPRADMTEPDAQGLKYYTDVLEAVKAAGLTPLITLYHWDLPAWLYNFGDTSVPDKKKTYGWLDMRDAKENLALLEFQKYTAAVYQHFGKYASHISTFNEPLTFTNVAFLNGTHAPGRYGFEYLWKKDPGLYGTDMTTSKERVPYLQAINLIKAHDIAYKTMHAMYDDPAQRTKYHLKEPKVTIVLNSDWAEPFRIQCDKAGQNCQYHPKDIEASGRHMDYMLGWWLHPVMFGSWPASMNKVYNGRIKGGLGQFDDSSCLRNDGKPVKCDKKNTLRLTDDIKRGGTLDELAINHYTGYFVVDMDYAKSNKDKVPPNQYGGSAGSAGPGWDTDQNVFTTQFRYLKYGDNGPLPAAKLNPPSKRAYIIGSAGAQPWLRQSWFVYRKLMQYINAYYLHNPDAKLQKTTKHAKRFTDLSIYLTENGTSIWQESQKDPRKNGVPMDVNRVQYMVGNLGAIHQAKEDDKINIKLYTYWSIADNFEWAEGYDSRFGLIWIDYQTLERIPKQSYLCFRSIIKANKDKTGFPFEDCKLR